MPPDLLLALASAVVASEAVIGLLSGYAQWDGAEPTSLDESAWADGGFDPKVGRWDPGDGSGITGQGGSMGGGGFYSGP